MPLHKGKSEKAFKENIKTEMEHGKPQNQALAIAYSMKRKAKAKKMAEGGDADSGKNRKDFEKGVHKPAFDMQYHQGTSHAGRDAKYGGAYFRQTAKAQHRNKLEELRSMKKPKLMAHGGMAEHHYDSGGDVAAEPTPTFGSDSGAKALFEGFGNIAGTRSGGGEEEDKGGGGGEGGASGMMKMLPMLAMAAAHGGIVDRIMSKRANHYSKGGMVANGGDADFDNLADSRPANYDDLSLRDTLESHYGDDDNSGDALGNEQEDHDRHDIVARILKSRAKKDRMPRPA